MHLPWSLEVNITTALNMYNQSNFYQEKECGYCHRRGHIKKNCFAKKKADKRSKKSRKAGKIKNNSTSIRRTTLTKKRKIKQNTTNQE
jgi:hypothetical protein